MEAIGYVAYNFNLYRLNLIMHLQGQVSQCKVCIWFSLHGGTLGDMQVVMQVVYPSCATNVWCMTKCP